MIVLTLARKPVVSNVARNALSYGTGGINLDASRIGTFKNTTPSGSNRFNAALARQGYRPKAYEQPEKAPDAAAGRFPANVLFQHLDGCRPSGTSLVKRNVLERTRSGGRGTTYNGGKDGSLYGAKMVAADILEVDTYDCEEGCPVKTLDEQSGELHARGNQNPSTQGGGSGVSVSPGGVRYSNHHERPELKMSGGASRFFKQFGGAK